MQHETRLKKRTHNVVELAVEAYLRLDLLCGSPECTACPGKRPQLPCHARHYIIPDADALEDCLAVFELPDFSGFILLTSVLQKVNALQTHSLKNLAQKELGSKV